MRGEGRDTHGEPAAQASGLVTQSPAESRAKSRGRLRTRADFRARRKSKNSHGLTSFLAVLRTFARVREKNFVAGVGAAIFAGVRASEASIACEASRCRPSVWPADARSSLRCKCAKTRAIVDLDQRAESRRLDRAILKKCDRVRRRGVSFSIHNPQAAKQQWIPESRDSSRQGQKTSHDW
jgi:hypothetical protein